MKKTIVTVTVLASLMAGCTGGPSNPGSSGEGHALVTFDDAGKCELSSYYEQGTLFRKNPKSADVDVVDVGGDEAMKGRYLRIAGKGAQLVVTHPAPGGFCGIGFDYRANESNAVEVVLENEGNVVRRAKLPSGSGHFVLHSPSSRHSIRFTLNQVQGTQAVETFLDNMTVDVPDVTGSCVPFVASDR